MLHKIQYILINNGCIWHCVAGTLIFWLQPVAIPLVVNYRDIIAFIMCELTSLAMISPSWSNLSMFECYCNVNISLLSYLQLDWIAFRFITRCMPVMHRLHIHDLLSGSWLSCHRGDFLSCLLDSHLISKTCRMLTDGHANFFSRTIESWIHVGCKSSLALVRFNNTIVSLQ